MTPSLSSGVTLRRGDPGGTNRRHLSRLPGHLVRHSMGLWLKGTPNLNQERTQQPAPATLERSEIRGSTCEARRVNPVPQI